MGRTSALSLGQKTGCDKESQVDKHLMDISVLKKSSHKAQIKSAEEPHKAAYRGCHLSNYGNGFGDDRDD
jgi:hypothetical protein